MSAFSFFINVCVVVRMNQHLTFVNGTMCDVSIPNFGAMQTIQPCRTTETNYQRFFTILLVVRI